VNCSLASGSSDEVSLRGQVLILGAIATFCVSVCVMSLSFTWRRSIPYLHRLSIVRNFCSTSQLITRGICVVEEHG
jgi:hypothetical protein